MDKMGLPADQGAGGASEPKAWVDRGALLTGTVTFLFTDIEGSVTHWESQPGLMEAAIGIHNNILFKNIQANGGSVFKIVGDEFQAVFPTAQQALQAAIDCQIGLHQARWNEIGALKVRMGIHTGEAHLDDIGDEYAASHTKNRVGRIRSAAHGGQVLLSQASADLCQPVLPAGVQLRYLGEFRMKGMARREPLFQVIAPGLPEQFPPLATPAEPKHNLPRQLTPFIGRQKEIEQVKALLETSSMVTLTGSGGVGKTRLSIRVAEDLVHAFADGVWYVELDSLTDPKLVDQTVALTIGLRQEAGFSFQGALEQFLKSRQVLLVLDNCEHLIDACARLADNLLRQCPQLKLLASSREALGVAGETIYHVPSLAMPDLQELANPAKLMEYDALRLFVERGRAVLPDFQITSENAPHIQRICERLDGIPLALELAAARLSVLNTEQVASRLDNTFRLLVGGARTAVPRQQTLRATIDWSYQLLKEQERLLLRRLSVFFGGFILEGAEAVCSGDGLDEGEILDLLASLVNKSIIIADRVLGAKPRYHLLETVRQYAREKLFDSGESKALRDRHLDYYVRFADLAEPQLHGAGRLEWTGTLTDEHANIREALEWAFNDPTLAYRGLQIATAITDRFWFILNLRDGEGWLKRGLEVTAGNLPPHLLARTYYCLGRMMALKDRPQCQQYLNLCISLSREITPVADRELALALSLSADGLDAETALRRSEEGVQVARSLASTDIWPLAESLYFRSNILLSCGYQDQAFATAQECVRVVESGDRWMAGGYWISGIIQTLMDQPEQARKNLEKGLDLCVEVVDRFGVWYSLIYLAWHYLYTGDLHRSHAYCQDLFKLNDRLKIPFHCYDLGLMGLLLARYQREAGSPRIPEEWLDAVRILAAFEKWGRPYFSLAYELVREDHEAALTFLRQMIDPACFEATWEEGWALASSLDEAIKYAQNLGEKYTFSDHSPRLRR